MLKHYRKIQKKSLQPGCNDNSNKKIIAACAMPTSLLWPPSLTLNTRIWKAGISRRTPFSVHFTELIGWARIWVTGMSHFFYDVT